MRAQRPGSAAPAIIAQAEQLPLDVDAVDAVMACFTIHHWQSPREGLDELQRVARKRVQPIPIPADCTDGFIEAFWNRPEALLDPRVRAAQSLWRRIDATTEERIVARLDAALASGEWDAEHGALRGQASFDGSVRLVVAELGVKD